MVVKDAFEEDDEDVDDVEEDVDEDEVDPEVSEEEEVAVLPLLQLLEL